MRKCILLVALLCVACTAPPKLEESKKGMLYREPYAKVWSAIIEVISSGGHSIETIDKESGLITLNPGAATLAYCNCGSSLFTVVTEARGRFNVFVKSESDSVTVVTVNAFFEGLRQGVGEYWMPCASNGKMEAEFFSTVDGKL